MVHGTIYIRLQRSLLHSIILVLYRTDLNTRNLDSMAHFRTKEEAVIPGQFLTSKLNRGKRGDTGTTKIEDLEFVVEKDPVVTEVRRSKSLQPSAQPLKKYRSASDGDILTTKI